MKRQRSLVLGVGLALALVGCSSEGPESADTAGTTPVGASESIGDEGTPIDGGVLTVAIDSESSGWNPAIDRWATSGALVGSTILEPLATLDGDAVAQPWLAEDWDANDTYDVWTVRLREGVTFHDGAAFDANAAKANLDFIVTAPLSAVAMKPLFDEVVVIDPLTIEVHLTTPWAAFPSSFMAGQSALMRSPASMETEDRGSTEPIGTGPFVFDQWEPDTSLDVTANADYWRDGEPHLEAIEFQVIADAATRTSALEAGDVDLAITARPDDAISMEEEFTVLRNWDVEPSALLANVRPTVGGVANPMSNLHARLAIAHAIDRETIASTVGDDVQEATSPFAPGTPWGQPSDENGYPDFDLDAAEAELAAYLEETGADSLRVEIIGPATTSAEASLQLVEEQLGAVGIETEVSTFEQATLINRVVGASYQIAMFANYTSPDPDQNHYFWSKATAGVEGGISINFTGFTNDVTETALRTGRESEDVEVRQEAYNTLVEEQNANAVNLWLYYTPYSLIAAPEVRGLQAVDEVPFANFQPKTWWGGIWLADA